MVAIGSLTVALLSRFIRNFALYKKKALWYLFYMALVFGVVASLPYLFTNQNLMSQYIFYMVWFLGLGIVHCHFMYTRFWANEKTLGSELAALPDASAVAGFIKEASLERRAVDYEC